MANFVISRARRLFSYSDLGGTNGSTMDLEASSNSTVTEVKGIFKQRKKCILVFTAIFGLMVVIIIGKKTFFEPNHKLLAILRLFFFMLFFSQFYQIGISHNLIYFSLFEAFLKPY